MVTPPYSSRSRPSFSSFFRHWLAFLSGDARERANFLLGDIEVARQVRIENRIEQRGDAAGEPRRRIQRAAVFEQGDELAEAFVELSDQEPVEADAVFEQPHEGRAVHDGEAGVAQRHHVVAAGLILEHGALPEPGAGGQAGETGRLAAAGDRAHPGEAGDDAAPVIEAVATHEDEFVGTIGFLDDAGARDLGLPLVQFTRPDRDAPQIIRSNHDPVETRLRHQRHFHAALQQAFHLRRPSGARRCAPPGRRNLPAKCQAQDISTYRFTY